jgi:hypothetical protein
MTSIKTHDGQTIFTISLRAIFSKRLSTVFCTVENNPRRFFVDQKKNPDEDLARARCAIILT